MQPLISVIIVNWNTRELIAECLQSVAAEADRLRARTQRIGNSTDKTATVEPSRFETATVEPSNFETATVEPSNFETATVEPFAVETIVVDNASQDDSVAMLRREYPWVHVIENQKNIGFAAANNQALPHCHGQYILLLNSDTKVLPGAFYELLDFMNAHPTVGATGARYFNPDGSLQPSCYPAPTVGRELWRLFHLDKFYAYGTYHMQQWSVAQPREVDIVQGAALMVRRTVAQELSLFDPDYFMYTEEVDLCRRIRQAGWQIFWVPQSTIIHYGGQSTKQIARVMFLQLYRSKILYFRKHHGYLATFAYKWVLLLATVVRLLLTTLVWTQHRDRRRQSLTLANHYRHLALSLPAM